ncbi:MAG: TonB-dependent receptor [Bacteroidales bacterium]|jgi:outer membrane cobalamin receptor|nr:TonB-dependent receptor [Bacteroidales bacterium]
MKHVTLVMLLAIVPAIHAFTQNIPKKHTISGYMKDSLSTESLIGATVYNKVDFAGTSSNQYGFYSLTLPAGNVELVYSHVGFNTQIRRFRLQRDTVIQMNLEGSVHLQEVTVTASRTDRIQERTQMSAIHVPIAQIKSLPAFLGEVDLLKSLQLMPGIQSGGEGSSGLYVRGGGPDQNLILLDGVPVYNASHLFGFFSVFNADAINNVDVLKGGFPARYGGRVSSVIDISMKEGNMQQFHGEGAVGIVATRMTLEGPIWKDHTSFIVSGRRTYIDLLAKPFIAMSNKTNPGTRIGVGYYFYDLTAKINHRFSAKDRIYLSAYMGDDKFYANEDDTSGSYNYKYDSGLKWGNITGAFRWNHIFTPKLFSNTTVTYSRYRFHIDHESWETSDSRIEESQYYAGHYQSGINDWSYKTVFDYLPAPAHYIRFGANVIYHTFNPGAMQLRENTLTTDIGSNKIYTYEYSAYAEDDIRLADRLKANLGVHWSAFSVRGKLHHVWQPRVSARYLLTDQLSVKAAYSRMAQYIHLLTNSNVGLPTDLWVPVTDRLKPQISGQVALGIAQNLREEYEISLEGYYKTMNNVLEYKEGASFLDTNGDWEDKVLQGEGRSYGVELFAQKKTGSFTGWIGYTLSWTDRQFDGINEGRRFPYKYDRRHDLSIALMKRLGRKIELSGTWVFGTGNCVSVPIGIFKVDKPFNNNSLYDYYYDYGERNSYRMAPYHRLDLSIAFVKEKRWGERRWIIGAYNAYSRKNPFYIDVRTNQNGRYEYVQYSLFPVIPSISYQFKF